MRRTILITCLVALSWGCATQEGPTSTPEATVSPSASPQVECVDLTDDSGAPAHVVMSDFSYEPACFTVSASQGLDLENRDQAPHSFTIDDELDLEVPAGEHNRTESVGGVLTPGGYEFYCRYHPEMRGRVSVEA